MTICFLAGTGVLGDGVKVAGIIARGSGLSGRSTVMIGSGLFKGSWGEGDVSPDAGAMVFRALLGVVWSSSVKEGPTVDMRAIVDTEPAVGVGIIGDTGDSFCFGAFGIPSTDVNINAGLIGINFRCDVARSSRRSGRFKYVHSVFRMWTASASVCNLD